MAEPSITIRISPSIKSEILNLVNSDKYRSVTDFIDQAIREKLKREEIPEKERFKAALKELIETDPEITTVILHKITATVTKIPPGEHPQ